MTSQPLAEQTPVEIDEKISALEVKMARLEHRVNCERMHLTRLNPVEDPVTIQSGIDDMLASLKVMEDEVAPLHEQWRQRRWTRAFLATSNNGHVHRSTSCSTCRPTTSFYWVTALSGHEMEIIEQAGENACTVCYPNAPVDTLRRKTSIYSPDQVKAAEDKAERNAAKAKREADKAAKSITTPDGGPLIDKLGFTIKTERTAQIEAVAAAIYIMATGEDFGYDYDGSYTKLLNRLIEALAHKRGTTTDTQRALVEAKATAKYKKDWC